MLFMKGKSPVLVEDWSCLYLLYNVVPSVWSNFESVIWCYNERDLNRELYVNKETELYELNSCLLYTSYLYFYLLYLDVIMRHENHSHIVLRIFFNHSFFNLQKSISGARKASHKSKK